VIDERPALGSMLWRALRLRCAWCGSRHGIVRGWFHRHDTCQHCGMSVQRGQDGFELGAASVNAILTLGALIGAATIAIVVMYPDVSTGPLVAVLVAVAVVLPVLLYPFTSTIWFAIELLMERPSADEIGRAHARVEHLAEGA
jgi:uncharacterized protein (DUF983 family)